MSQSSIDKVNDAILKSGQTAEDFIMHATMLVHDISTKTDESIHKLVDLQYRKLDQEPDPHTHEFLDMIIHQEKGSSLKSDMESTFKAVHSCLNCESLSQTIESDHHRINQKTKENEALTAEIKLLTQQKESNIDHSELSSALKISASSMIVQFDVETGVLSINSQLTRELESLGILDHHFVCSALRQDHVLIVPLYEMAAFPSIFNGRPDLFELILHESNVRHRKSVVSKIVTPNIMTDKIQLFIESSTSLVII